MTTNDTEPDATPPEDAFLAMVTVSTADTDAAPERTPEGDDTVERRVGVLEIKRMLEDRVAHDEATEALLIGLRDDLSSEGRGRRMSVWVVWLAIGLSVLSGAYGLKAGADSRTDRIRRTDAIEAREAVVALANKITVRCAILSYGVADHAQTIEAFSDFVSSDDGRAFVEALKQRYAASDAAFADKLDVDCPG